jgi:hypothetical protein
MPTYSRHRTRGRAADVARLDASQEFILSWADAATLGAIGPGWESVVSEAWEVHGDDLAEAWIADYPGTRPALWWALTHRRPRAVVNTMSAEAEASARRHHTLFGVLATPFNVFHGHGAEPGEVLPWLEDSAAYLNRLGLLTEAEKTTLNL